MAVNQAAYSYSSHEWCIVYKFVRCMKSLAGLSVATGCDATDERDNLPSWIDDDLVLYGQTRCYCDRLVVAVGG